MRFERDLGTGCLRGIDQHPVDDGTPGRVKAINIVRGLICTATTSSP
jgi:hypothetical protein